MSFSDRPGPREPGFHSGQDVLDHGLSSQGVYLRGAHQRHEEPILLATVSGIATTNPGMIRWFADETDLAIITTKSIQVHPNPGNREPVITEPHPGCFGNAVGLLNPGVETAAGEFQALRRLLGGRVLLNISLAGRDASEFALLAGALAPSADLLELNLSCPHAREGYGSSIGCDPALVDDCTAAAVDAAPGVPVLAKLTPNVESLDQLAAIARRAVAAGAAGIAAINTVGPYQYREPHTGTIILNNPAPADAPELEGRGGRSGRWVRERALECVRVIRDALGPGPLVIGMGGVETPNDARAMREAGADVVGVGSVLALVHQREWPALFRSLSRPAPPESPSLRTTIPAPEIPVPLHRADPVHYRIEAGMSLVPRTVTARRELGGGLFELELEGTLPFEPGQSCFLRLPRVGEKPFSPALTEPATFLIRRRGPVTTALGSLERGDTVFLRGPYGEGPGVMDTDRLRSLPRRDGAALILAAGSGAALVPGLVQRLAATSENRVRRPSEIWIGLRDEVHTVPLAGAIRRHAALTVIRDEGIQGRVLTVAETTLRPHATGDPVYAALWIIGPDPFMEAAVDLGERLGISRKHIRLSREQKMLCGVGLCGMCHHEGRLTCSYGTFGEVSR